MIWHREEKGKEHQMFKYVHEVAFKAKIVSADSDWCSSGGATT